MEKKLLKHIDLLIDRYPILKECEQSIIQAYDILEECFETGHKLLIAGNGGSCADSEHIVGELMKGFKLPRKCSPNFAEKLCSVDEVRGSELAERLQGGLPAIALDGHQGLNTAYINDVQNGGLLTYAQQVYGYGKAGDVFLGISTSGNSKNVMNATVVARALELKVIGLTGKKGGELATVADVAIKVPETETYMIQELHLPVYHALCLMREEKFFEEK
jgi:D-sedoheptulose 7-phosphate isomerase